MGHHLVPSEKYEFVSWDDDIPNIWKKKQTTNQIIFMCPEHSLSHLSEQNSKDFKTGNPI